MLWIALFLILALLAAHFLYFRPYSYWRARGVPQSRPVPLFGDNWQLVLRLMSIADFMKHVYNIAPHKRYVGFYQFLTPALAINDPELIKRVCIKDFEHFVDHRGILPADDPILGKNLFTLKGQRWKEMRTVMSPCFTSSKMRAMFTLMLENAQQFTNHFLDKGEDLVEMEMRDAFTKYANDVIASTAFGIKIDSLTNPKNDFYVMGTDVSSFTGVWKNVKFILALFLPKVLKLFGLSLFPKEFTLFFKNVIDETVALREKNNVVRPDLIHILMEARRNGHEHGDDDDDDAAKDLPEAGYATASEANLAAKAPKELTITNEDITGQGLVFFFAGFDSVSNLMCFLAHELAVNPDVQRKLIAEVDGVKHKCGKILTYEAVLGMKYLDMVVSETLRKWTNAVGTDRICTKDYVIEPERPDERPLLVKKGTMLWIPFMGLHWDPKHHPEPERFIPERFSEENKHKIAPYTYMPFGIGPRNCIASRFALLETKAIFYNLLSNYEFVPIGKTAIPLKLSKNSLALTAEGGFWLGMKRRL